MSGADFSQLHMIITLTFNDSVMFFLIRLYVWFIGMFCPAWFFNKKGTSWWAILTFMPYPRLNQRWTLFKVIADLLRKKKKFLNYSFTHLRFGNPSERWQWRTRKDERFTTNSFYHTCKSQRLYFFYAYMLIFALWYTAGRTTNLFSVWISKDCRNRRQ